ncbi:MAG: DNA-binding protein, partial [Rhizobiales bacterium]|nr:DNA-binding protein [Hyphomicrobiales bacterium]
MCILTRARGDKADLIRFVLSPDGVVTPDLKLALPGRGAWVTADRKVVDEAASKGAFARAFKTKLAPPEDLGSTVDALLLADLTGMMNMARKSGQFIGGSGKAEAAIRSGEAIALFHASDAAADGVRKLGQAVKARALTLDEPEIPVFRLMTGEQMDACFG